MALECGVCGAVEGRNNLKIDVVCHHCGKPLCEKHRNLFVDDVFGPDETPVSRQAYHCDECKKAYHPRAAGGRKLL